MNTFLFLAASLLFALACALPEDRYEIQRICWKNKDCTARAAPAVVIPGVLEYGPTDDSVEYPGILGEATAPVNRLVSDEYRSHGILGRDDVDALLLTWNHSASAASTSVFVNTQLLLQATDRTTNVEVVLAVYDLSGVGFPAAADGVKDVSDASIRARVPSLPAAARLVGSVSLATADVEPNYVVSEAGGIKYWTYANYTGGCAITPGPPPGLPFDLDNCDLSNGLRLNRAKVALPAAGKLLFVLYEKKGRPVPYIVGSGSISLTNYIYVQGAPPAFNLAAQFPQFVYKSAEERATGDANFRMLKMIGMHEFKNFDLSAELEAL